MGALQTEISAIEEQLLNSSEASLAIQRQIDTSGLSNGNDIELLEDLSITSECLEPMKSLQDT